MSRVVVDATLHEKLLNICYPVELVDAQGNVLGRYTPDLSQFDFGPEISEEELDRRANSDKWYTTEEVLAHLKKLEDSQ